MFGIYTSIYRPGPEAAGKKKYGIVPRTFRRSCCLWPPGRSCSRYDEDVVHSLMKKEMREEDFRILENFWLNLAAFNNIDNLTVYLLTFFCLAQLQQNRIAFCLPFVG